ncbi:MAG: hypothetical protein KAU07_00815 [Candidatus Andersenbacteria bacterium]|nr:hypothetical protein [Candidatus Andersenbacteria bacterium]
MSLIELITMPIFNLIVWIFSILPTIYLPQDFLTAVDTGVGYLTTLGYFVSLPTIASILSLYLAWYFFKLILHAITFFMAFIPFVKTK